MLEFIISNSDYIRIGLEVFGILGCAYFGINYKDYKTVMKILVNVIEDNKSDIIKKEVKLKSKKSKYIENKTHRIVKNLIDKPKL